MCGFPLMEMVKKQKFENVEKLDAIEKFGDYWLDSQRIPIHYNGG